jgi:predicted dehydrogenase/threonine dehydrogenase-like Zn-dependent dehydrogenase
LKQILQSLKSGATEVAEVPCPTVKRGQLLIRTSRTLVSAGTERMLVEFGKAGWIEKARQQPDKVRMVLDKIRTDGLLQTFNAVRNKLDQALPMGYCNVGVVLEVGAGVKGFEVGDRVVSNGRHAEIVCVPVNLAAKIPDGVQDEEAVFAVLGAIALQGLRLAQPTLGEAFVVTGLGLIGLLAVQLLRAQGCRVLGIDYDRGKLDLARRFGADIVDLSAGEDPLAAAAIFSRGRGVDGVLIAAATDSSEPVHQAAVMCRKRGRIVLVGVTGLELSRADFYEKELTFQVSCSYGPGRYDVAYEEKGQDYPVGFVRWTEQRNLEAVLDMLADRRLDVKPLVTHRFRLEGAGEAYRILADGLETLGIMLEYPGSLERAESGVRVSTVQLASSQRERIEGQVVVAFIGAGNYAGAVLAPAFRAAGARLRTIASGSGVSGLHVGRRFAFEETTTATDEVFQDPSVSAVVIATRHDSHAQLVCRALQASKCVFVEKPLTIDRTGLDQIRETYSGMQARGVEPFLMVGFNRRFSTHVQRLKTLLNTVKEPKVFVMTVNAGAIVPEHWTQDPFVGGGRIVGEACHFVDLLRYLAAAPIIETHATPIGQMAGTAASNDKVSITLRFADGSLGTIHYLANGHRSFPKERLEVFCAGRVLQLDNFRRLRGYGWPNFSKMNLWRQDKGNSSCVAAFVGAAKEGTGSPIPFAELLEVTEATLLADEQVRA